MHDTDSNRGHRWRGAWSGVMAGACEPTTPARPPIAQSRPLQDSESPSAAPPAANVVFLMDNSESMLDFPQYLPEDFTPGFSPPPNSNVGTPGYVGPEGDFTNTGCSDPALVAAMDWFDKNSPDPAKNGSVAYDDDPFFQWPLFVPDQFYHARGRRIAWQQEDYPFSLTTYQDAVYPEWNAFNTCFQMVPFSTGFENTGRRERTAHGRLR